MARNINMEEVTFEETDQNIELRLNKVKSAVKSNLPVTHHKTMPNILLLQETQCVITGQCIHPPRRNTRIVTNALQQIIGTTIHTTT